MKTKINSLLGAGFALLVLPLAANAATGPCATIPTTQVYDLKADWSDTQNPNGAWSYLDYDLLLISDPVPWWTPRPGYNDRISRTAGSDVVPGKLELGDIFVEWPVSATGPRWTAPAAGTINVSATAWMDMNGENWEASANWWLLHNGFANVLSSGLVTVFSGTRDSPYDFSSGSGGTSSLQNIAVQAGDRIQLAFGAGNGRMGLNFTITFTTDANSSFAEDAIIWHQPLARNGASEDTDPSAGRTVKYRFKRGSTIPIQIHALGCDGADVTSNANVIGQVTVFGDSNCDGAADANSEPIEFNGVGGGGGVMDKIGGHLKYNLDTKSLPTTTQCYILRVTVTDAGTGEEKFEEVLLQAK